MKIIITYDVDREHLAIRKDHCLKNGLTDRLPALNGRDGENGRLPNTTLVGEFDNVYVAFSNFQGLVKAAAPDAYVRKFVAVPLTEYCVISDERIGVKRTG